MLTTEELYRRAQNLLALRSGQAARAWPDPSAALTLVDCDGPSGSLTLSCETQPWMANIMGIVHGGVTAALLDTSMGITCACQCGSAPPTITLTLNYARPVPLEAAVHVRTRTVRIGRTTGQMAAELFLPDRPGEVLVTASGVFHIRQSGEA